MKNIALIGFMGTGKTTVATLLADELKATLVETDTEILRLSGLTSVTAIFETKGEEYFRELEQEVITAAVKKDNCVISCGGGVISSEKNMDMLKQNTFIVFLHTSFEVIKERLKNTNTRPLFNQEEKAVLLYAQRLSLYRKYANFTIDTDDKKPKDIVTEIISNKS
jgi:shikimate kinase